MKKAIFILLVVMGITSCRKQEPLGVQYYPYCGQWGSANHSLEIWEDGHGKYAKRMAHSDAEYTCKVYFSGNTLSFKGSKRINYTIDEAPHLDSLSGLVKMKLSGEEFIKN